MRALRPFAVCLALLAPCAGGVSSAQTPAARPPNVIVILADDLGYGDIGAFAETPIATPRLDAMAAEGAMLTDFYASANVCTPSRAGLLTGRYPMRTGLAKSVLFPDAETGLPPEEITIAELLKARGYATLQVGKWHLGSKPPFWPTSQGFDEFFGVSYSNDMSPFRLYRGTEIVEEPVDQASLTRRYTDEAIAFIEAHRDGPFFVYLAHTFPHYPLHSAPPFEGTSKAGLYGDTVEEIDASTGRILDALKALGLDDDTLVLVTSDNGPWFEGSAGPYRARKGATHEGSFRVPFIARWPGHIPPGTRSAAMAMNIDILPTVAALAGASLPEARVIDGRDIWPLLQGAERSPHESLVFFVDDKIAALRTARWRYVVSTFYRTYLMPIEQYPYCCEFLFDMESDPSERYSRVRDQPGVVAQMRAELARATAEITAPAPQGH